MTLHGRATPGSWAQGTSSHHTVSKREGKEDYHVANFHHADDASFIDNAHKYMPLLIEEIHRLRQAATDGGALNTQRALSLLHDAKGEKA